MLLCVKLSTEIVIVSLTTGGGGVIMGGSVVLQEVNFKTKSKLKNKKIMRV